MSNTMLCPHCARPVVFQSSPLTQKQWNLLSFIDASIRERGCAPSFDEIATRFRYRSLATVHEHLGTLERKGVIQRSYNEARAIRVLVRPEDVGVLALKAVG